jgi:alpha-tubulin suppressor-like RCC1 family protein
LIKSNKLLFGLLLSSVLFGCDTKGTVGDMDVDARRHRLALGDDYSCTVADDMTVWCWGQYPDSPSGFATDRANRVDGLAGIVSLSGGNDHACALDEDGDVWCWGRNLRGQLGRPATTTGMPPGRVPLAGRATAVDSGYQYSCAVIEDGAVWCWGMNSTGEIGDGSDRDSPTRVAGLPPTIVDVATSSGEWHSCARSREGELWCWGYGYSLSEGTKVSPLPRRLEGLEKVTAVSVGEDEACAVVRDGGVWCWDPERYRDLGGPGAAHHPVKIRGLPPVTRLSTGTSLFSDGGFSCAITTDHAAFCWGSNERGELGNGSVSTTGLEDPTRVKGLKDVVEIAAGGQHGCAIAKDGKTHCWGRNLDGQIGDTTGLQSSVPVPVVNSSGTKSVATGDHSCLLRMDGSVWCWGNGIGLGVGAPWMEADEPIPVASTHKSSALAAYNWHSCSADLEGRLWCWGYGYYGQLGGGVDKTVAYSPRAVLTVADVASFALGQDHTCAVDTKGDAWCWGRNGAGQLGTGDFNDASTPKRVSQVPVLRRIAAGGDFDPGTEGHTCGVDGKGSVWCWGDNGVGQLGVPVSTGRATPLRVEGLPASKEVTAGGGHTCSLSSDGRVFCWGFNGFGELGDGEGSWGAHRWRPVEVIGVTGASAIAAGYWFTCALKSDGTVWCWGDNFYGQLGDSSTELRTKPVQVQGLGNVQMITAGTSHACALLADRTVKCWGQNNGRLGDGSGHRPTPTPVVGLP